MTTKKKTIFTIYETRTHLSSLLKRVRAGEELTIARGHEAIAKLVPLKAEASPRIPGSAQDGFRMSDDFDAPLPQEILKHFFE